MDSLVLNVIAAGCLAIPGVAILIWRGREPWSLALGSFLTLWPLEIAAWGICSCGIPFHIGFAIGMALDIFLVVALGYFAVTYAYADGARTRRIVVPLLTAYGAAVSLAFAVRPQLFLSQEGIPRAAFDLLINLPLQAAFCAAFLACVWVYLRGLGTTTRLRSAILATALGLYLGYQWSFVLVKEVTGSSSLSATALSTVYLGAEIATVVLVGSVAAGLFVRTGGGRTDRVISAALAFALLTGILVAMAPVVGMPSVRLGSLFTLASAILLGYGVLKHEVFALDLKLKWTIHKGIIAGVFASIFFLVDQVAQYYVSSSYGAIAGIIAALLLLPLLAPVRKTAQRIADRLMPHVTNTEAYLSYRRMTIYRAAVEAAAANGRISEEERSILDTLRSQLGIAPAEASALDKEVLGRAAA